MKRLQQEDLITDLMEKEQLSGWATEKGLGWWWWQLTVLIFTQISSLGHKNETKWWLGEKAEAARTNRGGSLSQRAPPACSRIMLRTLDRRKYQHQCQYHQYYHWILGGSTISNTDISEWFFNTQTCLGVFHKERHLTGAETNIFFYLYNTVPTILQILLILLNIWCEQAKLPPYYCWLIS